MVARAFRHLSKPISRRREVESFSPDTKHSHFIANSIAHQLVKDEAAYWIGTERHQIQMLPKELIPTKMSAGTMGEAWQVGQSGRNGPLVLQFQT